MAKCLVSLSPSFFGSYFKRRCSTATETIDEFRLHLGTQLSETLSLDGSYYITRGDYHVPDPTNKNHWVDSIFPYSAPRVGLTWRVNRDAVIRAAAGGGFALPPLLNLVGQMDRRFAVPSLVR